MSKAGDFFQNPVTGEAAIVRIGTEESGGELLVADLYIAPGGAVMGEHYHPAIEERFTLIRGELGVRLGGRTTKAKPGSMLLVPPGVPHDWWNVGDENAVVRVEVRPAARFEVWPPRLLQRVLFGLVAPFARLLGYRGSYPEYLSRRHEDEVAAKWPTLSAPGRDLDSVGLVLTSTQFRTGFELDASDG